MQILSTAYLPNILYFSKLLAGEPVLIEAHEHYTKQTFRNRCEIYGANGRQTLSIPVRRVEGNHTPIRLVEVDNTVAWQNNHWRSIKSAYGSAAYFDFVGDVLQPFYAQRHCLLLELNMALLRSICRFMGVSPVVEYTSVFVSAYGDEVDDCRKNIDPKVRQWSQFGAVEYYQVFAERHGFLPNLSIIDLLFNEGLNAVNIVRRSRCIEL